MRLLREYLNLGSLATVAAVVGIGTSLYNSYENSGSHGGGGGGGGGAPGPTGSDVGAADAAWQQLLQRLMGTFSGEADALIPFLTQAFGSAGAETPLVQGRMRDIANSFVGQGQSLFGAGDELRGVGRSLWTTAQDPENALRDRTQQRVVDGSRAATSARGIGMSGESAGIENQAVGNFNLDWNDRQLGRQLAGAHGMAGMFNEGGRNTQAGAGLLTGAADMNLRALGLPFNIADLYSGSLNHGIYGPGTGIQGQIDPYIGLGQSGQQNSFNQGQTNLNNFTTGLQQFGGSPGYSWLQNFFGGGGGGGGGDGSGNSGSGASSWVDSSGWGGG